MWKFKLMLIDHKLWLLKQISANFPFEWCHFLLGYSFSKTINFNSLFIHVWNFQANIYDKHINTIVRCQCATHNIFEWSKIKDSKLGVTTTLVMKFNRLFTKVFFLVWEIVHYGGLMFLERILSKKWNYSHIICYNIIYCNLFWRRFFHTI